METKLAAAKEIGYKSGVKQIGNGITIAMCAFCIVMLCAAGLIAPNKSYTFGPLMVPLLLAIVLICFAVRRMLLFVKAPHCIVKMDDENLYFWCRGKWESVALRDIERVYLHTGRNSHHNGDITLYVTGDHIYRILDVEDFDEVKTRIGVSGRE